MANGPFKHYASRPKRLTAAYAAAAYEKLLKLVEPAEKNASPYLWLELFGRWNELKSYISSEGARRSFRHSQNVNDPQAASDEEYFRLKISPRTDRPEHELIRALLNSRWRGEVAQRYGEQLIPLYEIDIKTLDPKNTTLRVEAGKLTNRYEEMIAKASLTIRSREHTLWKSRSYFESPDESLRQEAFVANRSWFLNNHAKLSGIYADLVGIRHKMAKNLGYDNYVPFAYDAMCRTDYGPDAVRRFRQNVLKHIVPINNRLAAKRAAALNRRQLKPWDGYDPKTSLPLGIVPIKGQLEMCQKLFDKLSPRLGMHFNKMRRLNLIDLENRAGKRGGAFCTEFSDEGKVVIFCNSIGDAEDIETLVHEMGHAFQGWESQHIEAVDLQWGTMDLCEVYSTGLEFLSLPHIDNFLDKIQTKKFIEKRYSQSIGMLCYVCVVDEFQHWVYENPGASPDDRDIKWVELSRIYLPETNYSGFEKFRKLRWYAQSHIFVSPFYYIDYALAETCALQLALLARDAPKLALDNYLGLCALGGTQSFLSALALGGLRSPFEDKLFEDLTEFLTEQL